jgi:hypothetical protein
MAAATSSHSHGVRDAGLGAFTRHGGIATGPISP